MQIVIDIPDEQFITLNAKTQKEVISVIDHKLLISAIQNGIPLPKGHGDLIDRDNIEIYITKEFKGKLTENEADLFVQFTNVTDEIPAVIEADK